MRKLITADCHIAPPYDLTDELPEKYRQFFPHLEHEADGDYIVNPVRIGARGMMANNSRARRKIEVDAIDRARTANAGVAESSPSYEPAELLSELERDGVYGAVLISRVAYDDDVPAEAQVAYCRLVNDYLADQWRPYLDRVAPGILLPFYDVDACVKELERGVGLGLRPGLLPDAIWNHPYHMEDWEPLWEAAAGLNVPLTLHVGSLRNSPDGPSFPPYPGLSVIGFYNQSVAMGETLGWLVFSGVFKRYPDLHIIMTEGYAGWLGFAMQFFDHHFEDSRFLRPRLPPIPIPGFDRPDLDELPSAYLKRQAHATFMWDPLAIRERDLTGTDCLVWGNDYPHPEGSFPYSQEWVDKQFAGVPEATVDAITRGNAAKLFRISI